MENSRILALPCLLTNTPVLPEHTGIAHVQVTFQPENSLPFKDMTILQDGTYSLYTALGDNYFSSLSHWPVVDQIVAIGPPLKYKQGSLSLSSVEYLVQVSDVNSMVAVYKVPWLF